MRAIIRLDVPEWQIGQEVTVFFKDTMMKRSICEKEKVCKDCKYWIGGGIDEKDNFIPPKCTLFNEPQPADWSCPKWEE